IRTRAYHHRPTSWLAESDRPSRHSAVSEPDYDYSASDLLYCAVAEPQAKQKPRPKGRGCKSSGPTHILRLLLLAGLSVLAAEALHASRGVHQLLLAGKERMTVGADFYVVVAIVGGPGGERVPAREVHAYFVVTRMDSCLHVSVPLLESLDSTGVKLDSATEARLMENHATQKKRQARLLRHVLP